MTVSAVGASSIFAPSQSGVSKPSLRQQMSALFKDIQSGNLTAAKSDYSALSDLLGGPSGASASSGPFSAMLSQVGAALSSGDIAGAQSALSDFQTGGPSQALAQGQAADAAAGHHKHHHGVGKQEGVASLISAIQSGDLDGAQQAYASLTAGTDAGSAGTAQNSGSGNDIFSQLTASVGQSLANNDISGAQSDLTKFAQSHGVGSAVNVTA